MPSLGVVPQRKSHSTSSDDKKFAQPNDINAAEVVVNLLTHRKSFNPSSWPLLPGVPTFVPQETIFCVKSTFVSEMWGALCGCITQFSLEYDSLRSSKVTKESHEKVLSNAQRCLDGAKLAHEKLDGSMGKL
ncbi:hypothetical protein H5410_057026 [Solanum commersonii]|uniref:Uncharacterized protein n=1 Tax=Solanum commersonii TaxID=4109 RepID=A0A9J5WNY2_SOLCO|nr:hypothetical protein H5410_057026 [Solanum commersonii]